MPNDLRRQSGGLRCRTCDGNLDRLGDRWIVDDDGVLLGPWCPGCHTLLLADLSRDPALRVVR